MALDWNPVAPVRFIPSENGLVIHYIAWTPPFEDSWKLSFAGCTNVKFDKVGIGCVLRDQNAIFKHAVSAPVIGCTCTIEIELEALRFGLCEAVKLGIDYLEIEGESETAMRVILGHISPSTLLTQLLFDECVSTIGKFQMVSFHPVHDYANRAARKLAKNAIDEGQLVRWSKKTPPAISKILIEDIIGRYDFVD